MESIKTLRQRAGMTQTELAMALGLTQGTVSLWESGDTQPRSEMLPKLAKVLDCTIDDLFSVSTVDTATSDK